jgi:hypothetical protein
MSGACLVGACLVGGGAPVGGAGNRLRPPAVGMVVNRLPRRPTPLVRPALLVVAVLLGGLAGAWVGGPHATLCVDRVHGPSRCTDQVELSWPGALAGAALAGGTAAC